MKKTPSKRVLLTRREMLATLKLAYQNTLDTGFFYVRPPVLASTRKRRLSDRQARELGHRLAAYWTAQL